jgi:hypothetical protein
MDVRPGAPYNQRINYLGVNHRVPHELESTSSQATIDLPWEATLPDYWLKLRDLRTLEIGQRP